MFCVWCVSDGWWLLLFFLEEQCSHAAHFALLLHKDFEVLVDDCDSQEDSCTRTDGTQEVSHDRQPSYTEATKGSSCGDVPANMKVNYKYIRVSGFVLDTCSVWKIVLFVPVKFMHHRGLSVSPHYHLLLFQLLCHLRHTKWYRQVNFTWDGYKASYKCA